MTALERPQPTVASGPSKDTPAPLSSVSVDPGPLSDGTTPTVHPAVRAVLDVTPLLDGDGLVAVERESTANWYAPGEPHDPNVPDEYDVPVYDDPTPIAAKQAAAVLRWLLRNWGNAGTHLTVQNWMHALADEIDPPKETCADV